MKFPLKSIVAAAALAAATPSLAAVTVVGPTATAASCSAFTFSGATETACAGGYTGNLLQGTLQDPGLAAIQALGYSGSGAFLVKIEDLTGSTLDFGRILTGPTIIGIHYGAAGAAPEATSFFSFDAGAGTSTITVTGRAGANDLGLSNAVLLLTGSPVPEPATWAMMLMGFAGIGYSIRRRRSAQLQRACAG
jgi:hypothetical protein